ncbi:MAG: c-type cytochrome [Acidobacteriota bacterium]
MKLTLKVTAILFTIPFLVMTVIRTQTASAQTQPAQVMTAGKSTHFHNIKVLNDMPADQLGRVMNLYSASLGVDCDFCHVTSDFSKDDKKTKETAREMIKMVMAINKDNFNNRPRITCNSCHNGHMEPTPAPNLNAVAEPERPKQPTTKPTADQIFEKYVAALGGKDKVDKITSRIATATRTERNGKEVEQETVYYDAGKYALKTTYPKATVTEVFDGSAAIKFARQPIELRTDEQEQIKREAAVFTPSALRAAYTKVDFGFLDRIDGKEAYMLVGTTAANQRERLYFDVATGLLVRRTMASQTMFGMFQYQVDYMDYKAFGGVKAPTTIKYSMPNISWTRRILTLKNNVPVDASVFKAPAA